MKVKITMTLTASNFLVSTGPIIPALSSQSGNPGNAREKYSLNPSAEAAMGAENPTMKDTHPLKKP